MERGCTGTRASRLRRTPRRGCIARFHGGSRRRSIPFAAGTKVAERSLLVLLQVLRTGFESRFRKMVRSEWARRLVRTW